MHCFYSIVCLEQMCSLLASHAPAESQKYSESNVQTNEKAIICCFYKKNQAMQFTCLSSNPNFGALHAKTA